jgi:hypothetical protein
MNMNAFVTTSAGRRGMRAAPLAVSVLTALLLTACGGGGGNPGAVVGGSGGTGSTGTGTSSGTGSTAATATPTVTLAFVNTTGAPSNALSGATPLTAKATVLDKDRKPVAGAIVTFATDNALAVFSPSAGTALTDANGVASVTMRPASLASGGAGTVTATSSVSGTTVNGTANYSVGATTLAFGTLTASPASIQAYDSTVLSVDVMSGSSKYTEQQVNVTFGSDCVTRGKATLATTVATNNGTAQTVYRDNGCGNNDVITVSAGGVAKSASTTLTIAPPAAASVQFVSAAPLNQSIVLQGQGGNGRTETATLTFRAMDTFGKPLAGKLVSFSTTSPYVKINKTSDTTDASGNVVTTVNSGSVATSFRVRATLPGTAANGNPDLSTLSDSIAVTTGLPSQKGFSISSGSFNIEGWTVDSTTTTPATRIQVLLADDFGNPVPDGTPVVFQTNMGAVGSSDRGGCNTVNGGCVVDFRAQNPRLPAANTPATPCNATSPDSTRTGLATICASTTNGSQTVSAKTSIFFSGSFARKVYLNGSTVPLTGGVDFGTIKASQTLVFTLQLNDENDNPLPAGSKVEITSMLNGTAAAPVPAVVPNVAPHNAGTDDATGANVTGPQGYTHTFSVSSTNPTTCTGPASASFNVTVTTPAGSVTSIPFKLAFSCP